MRASIVLLIATAFSFSLAQAPAAPAVPNAPAAPAPPSAPAASSSSSPAPRKSQPARKPKKNKPQRSAHHGGHRRKHKNKRDDMSEMDDGLFEDLAAKDGGNADDPLIRRATVNGKKTKVDKVDDLVDVKVVASILRREETDEDLFGSMETMMDDHSAEDKEILRRAHKILSNKKGMPKQELINADVVADIFRRDAVSPSTTTPQEKNPDAPAEQSNTDDLCFLTERAILEDKLDPIADLLGNKKEQDKVASNGSSKEAKLVNLRRALLEDMDACKELVGNLVCEAMST